MAGLMRSGVWDEEKESKGPLFLETEHINEEDTKE